MTTPRVAGAQELRSHSSATTARGRPRNPETDAAILGAAMRMLVDEGYEGLSIERVAVAAGVAKTTIYRRYPAKRDLVIAALRAGTEVRPLPETIADTRAALGALVHDVVEALAESGAVRVLASLLAADAREPGLMDEFRARIIEPRRRAIAAILSQGIERHELRPDLDPLVVTEMLAGSVLAHHLVLGRTADPAWTTALADTLWRAIAASQPAPGPRRGAGGRSRDRRA